MHELLRLDGEGRVECEYAACERCGVLGRLEGEWLHVLRAWPDEEYRLLQSYRGFARLAD